MTNYTSHAQWALSRVVEIDRHECGFCGAFFRCSAERRQVIAAYLAAIPAEGAHRHGIGRFLLEADHRSILAAAYGGEVPKGARGALRRAGAAVVEERFYTLLHELLTAPPHRAVARCISHLPPLTLTKLLVMRCLPDAICRANVVTIIDEVSTANDVATAFRLLEKRGVDGGELAGAIRKVKSERELNRVWKKWILKASAPRHPVPGDDSYRPLTCADDLREAATRFRNCASNRHTIDFLDDEAEHCFAEVRHCGEGAMVHLVRKGDQWWLEGLFGKRNARPNRSLRKFAEEYLSKHGVRTEAAPRRKKSDWDALRRLASNPFLEFDSD